MILDHLNIGCKSTQCNEGKHYYGPRRSSPGLNGPCNDCGANPVDWSRVHKRDLSDITNTFAAMRTELIRDVYWNAEMDETAINHARRKGWIKLRADIEQRIRKELAPANWYRDGWQTPRQGRVIYYAQHATGTCCRTCLAEWHNIPKGRAMTEEEIAYCAELIRLYIAERLPNLTEEPENIPRRKKSRESEGATLSDIIPAEPTVGKQIENIDDVLDAKRRRGRNAED